jgi:hypothetical protein
MCQQEDLVGRSGDIKQDQCSAARTHLFVQGDERTQTTGSRELYIAQVQMNDLSVWLFETSVDDTEAICGQYLIREPKYG